MLTIDSGGLQKEAHFFQRSRVTLRDETDWVEAGANVLVGAHRGTILKAAERMSQRLIERGELFGIVSSAEKIVTEMVRI